jgi:hypothetical protein
MEDVRKFRKAGTCFQRDEMKMQEDYIVAVLIKTTYVLSILLLMKATGTFDDHLASHGLTNVNILYHIEPDSGFCPMSRFGATLPAGLSWHEYHTLKVEVGVSRG